MNGSISTTDAEDIFSSQVLRLDQVALAVCMTLIILSSVVGNSVTLIAVYRVRSLHTMTSAFVVNLAVADALTGLTCMPFTLVSSLADRWVFGDFFCRVAGFLNSTFCATSLMTLGAVAVERYYAIVHPFRYHRRMTQVTTCAMIACTWLYSVFTASLPLVGWSHYVYWDIEYLCTVAWNYDVYYTTFMIVTCFGVQLSVLGFTYFHIFKVASRQHRAVATVADTTMSSRQPSFVMINITANNGTSSMTSAYRSRSSSESKAAFVLFIIIGTFLFCWTPHAIGMLCLAYVGDRCPLPNWYFAVSTWLAMLNSSCNPIIYGIMNRQFRLAYASILHCICRRRKNTS